MGIKDIWNQLKGAVNTEYDRRIRAASNVREYQLGGHGHHGADLHPEEERPDATVTPLGPTMEPSDGRLTGGSSH